MRGTAALDGGMTTEQLVASMMNSPRSPSWPGCLVPASLARADSGLATGRLPAIRPLSAVLWILPHHRHQAGADR